MILRRIANGIKNQDWFVVLIEIFIVVIGIYIGLQVDDWNKARQDRQVEQLYLQELYEDVQSDRETLTVMIENSENILHQMSDFLEQSALETPTWTLAEMNQTLRLIQNMPTVIVARRAFENLTGSGDLKLIRSRPLKNALAQYFSRAEVTELVQSTHEMELVQTYQPYIIENLDYQAVYYARIDDIELPPSLNEGRVLEVYKTREFRNILTQKFVIISDVLNQFRLLKVYNDTIVEILESELGVKSTETPEPAQP